MRKRTPVPIEPASGNDGPIEAGDARLREEGGQNVADDAANRMAGEDLEHHGFTVLILILV